MMKQTLNEIRRMQKIAGILKEENHFDYDNFWRDFTSKIGTRSAIQMPQGNVEFEYLGDITFPNGLSFEVGGKDPEGGKVISIEKFRGGYGISGMEWSETLNEPGDEGYTYYFDLKGNEAREQDILNTSR